jgi:adenosine deaminase
MTKENPPRHRIFYKSLPKIELHRHLEGSLRLPTMLEIARKHNLDLPFDNMDLFRPLVQVMDGEPFTYQNFLSKFASLRYFFQSKEVIKQITREAIIDAASDNVRYLELRFTPVALSRAQNYPLGTVMDWVIDTAEKTSQEFGIKTRLIASVNRHESVELAEEVAQLAADRISRGIVALDLAGSEADFPGREFASIFSEAKQAGLGITIHAGEWGGPEIIELAVNTLEAQRIGHGVRVMENPALVAKMEENQIPFEVCPTSNYQSGVTETLEDHPLPEMLKAGLNVTVNTDDPAISQIDLSDEYELCCETFGLTADTLKDVIVNAAEAAFLPEEEKILLLQSIEEELTEKIITQESQL